jgi:CheY-like chemotaxis protein
MEQRRDAHPKPKHEETEMSAWEIDADHYRPCLVLGHSDPVYAAGARRALRRLGWDVYLAGSGPEARRLARMLSAEIVILDTEIPEESGWLTCDKLVRDDLSLKVFLVSPTVNPVGEDFRTFVGASGLICYSDGVQALVDEVCGNVLSVGSL